MWPDWAIFCTLCNFLKTFFKKGPSRPLFVYFCPFLITISIQIEKSVDGVLGIWTLSHRMVGADKTTELWWPPSCITIVVLFWPVWPDWAISWTLGNFLRPLETNNLPQSFTFLSNFCEGVKIYNFSSENNFGQLF